MKKIPKFLIVLLVLVILAAGGIYGVNFYFCQKINMECEKTDLKLSPLPFGELAVPSDYSEITAGGFSVPFPCEMSKKDSQTMDIYTNNENGIVFAVSDAGLMDENDLNAARMAAKYVNGGSVANEYDYCFYCLDIDRSQLKMAVPLNPMYFYKFAFEKEQWLNSAKSVSCFETEDYCGFASFLGYDNERKIYKYSFELYDRKSHEKIGKNLLISAEDEKVIGGIIASVKPAE